MVQIWSLKFIKSILDVIFILLIIHICIRQIIYLFVH